MYLLIKKKKKCIYLFSLAFFYNYLVFFFFFFVDILFCFWINVGCFFYRKKNNVARLFNLFFY